MKVVLTTITGVGIKIVKVVLTVVVEGVEGNARACGGNFG